MRLFSEDNPYHKVLGLTVVVNVKFAKRQTVSNKARLLSRVIEGEVPVTEGIRRVAAWIIWRGEFSFNVGEVATTVLYKILPSKTL